MFLVKETLVVGLGEADGGSDPADGVAVGVEGVRGRADASGAWQTRQVGPGIQKAHIGRSVLVHVGHRGGPIEETCEMEESANDSNPLKVKERERDKTALQVAAAGLDDFGDGLRQLTSVNGGHRRKTPTPRTPKSQISLRPRLEITKPFSLASE